MDLIELEKENMGKTMKNKKVSDLNFREILKLINCRSISVFLVPLDVVD